jgi:hypothetical protein
MAGLVPSCRRPLGLRPRHGYIMDHATSLDHMIRVATSGLKVRQCLPKSLGHLGWKMHAPINASSGGSTCWCPGIVFGKLCSPQGVFAVAAGSTLGVVENQTL